ncbi:efflux RND transporter periplasmic adaptor subunit [Paludisphaera mucosa]|uniref:Efflux RND transporter periplasmic adaptor subunit n=1 Tax=Paludisphaera mucosa TaxID=3030827 RepID=A0ABT6FLJ6_9BACT|nr:efflux RND transporter periplasmic adaptor subunit [Paludisphaera mucosa]MDG3008434.1 efflux RND transporter periplasmic adaptor subunit [Paludisphaera mucosa]
MKRKLLVSSVAVLVLVAGLSATLARPQWLPSWARIDPGKLPTWARFDAKAPAAAEDVGLYCEEHGVPEKFCTLCHEELKDKLMLCKEHGNLPEDVCTLCHPEVEKKYNLKMCKEHGLPESFCFKCGKGPSASLGLPDDGWCAAHAKPEALCSECAALKAEGLPLPGAKSGSAKVCRDPLPLVRLASADLARQIGIQTAEVLEEEHAHRLVANAETAYDANHYADVSPRVSGFIREVRADLGRSVKRGEVLCIVDSAEVSTIKLQYLSADAALKLAEDTYRRMSALAAQDVVPRKEEIATRTALNQAKSSLLDARQKLKNLLFDDAALEEVLRTEGTGSLIDVVSPIDGAVVLRHAVKGEAVQATAQLFAVADGSRMWLWVDVYEADVQKVKPGQAVGFSISGTGPGDGPTASGEVTWVGAEVNEQTRTARIRAELGNPDGRLRANQFGEATIQIGSSHKAVVVPKEAVQRKDKVEVVFLPEGRGVYRPQRVTTKPTDRNDVLEVTWGLKPGQEVVSKGAFLLKTEIMKGAIGAGCCE